MTPTDADRERARAIVMDSEDSVYPESDTRRVCIVTLEDEVALALATVRAEEREACYDAVEAVAMRFRANHDPMSENAADECIAAIRGREGK